MPRLQPDRPYTCYFCGTEYTLHSYIETEYVYKRVARTGPKNCPCCTAPTLLGVRNSAQSAAKNIVSMYYNPSDDQSETPQSYLAGMYVDSASIDACLEEVSRIDFDAWETSLRRTDMSDPDTRREIQQEQRVLPQARQDAVNGMLLAKLQQVAETAKATIERRRAEWQRMYEQNCGGKDEK